MAPGTHNEKSIFKSVVWAGILLVSPIASWGQAEDIAIPYPTNKIHQLLPQPMEVKALLQSREFTINRQTILITSPQFMGEARYLKNLLEESTHINPLIDSASLILEVVDQPMASSKTNAILLAHTSSSSPEGYELMVNANHLTIQSGTQEGIMRGIQTVRQLLPSSFHARIKKYEWTIPALKIQDGPAFQHRGLLLDCSRHFFSKEVVKKYIDLLALYKMNTLHWHLTEDQGWRVEIDAFPLLNETGSWRIDKNGERYGGYYTKADIREVVAYAKERHITVIPEIEMPGHSQAAIASYPWLSCTGKKVEVANDWGVFKEIYCAGNDSVFSFLETVLREVMELFPSTYIHIGGDEAPKYRWENCSKCQQRIKDEGLEDEHALQSYFIKRIEKFLNENGRQLIGWDEILEGGLSDNATVQSWRGMEGGITAANSGHKAIMSPTSHAYFDYDLRSIDLEKVYGFDPIPKEIGEENKHLIIGGECNIWTERVPDENNLDSKVFPRLFAMSEVLWSYPQNRDYDEFYGRVQHHYPTLKNLQVNYGLETIPARIEVKNGSKGMDIHCIKTNSLFELQYQWACDTCSNTNEVTGPVPLNRSGIFSVKAFKNNLEYGSAITQELAFHKGLGNPVAYEQKYSDWYTAGGDQGLTDGKLGSLDFRDGCWQGFYGDDVETVVDLGKVEDIRSISTRFYQYNNSWIFLPSKVTFEISEDGKKFHPIAVLQRKIQPEERGHFIEAFAVSHLKTRGRFIRINGYSIKKVPSWHEAAGSKAWLFLDEIVIQ